MNITYELTRSNKKVHIAVKLSISLKNYYCYVFNIKKKKKNQSYCKIGWYLILFCTSIFQKYNFYEIRRLPLFDFREQSDIFM